MNTQHTYVDLIIPLPVPQLFTYKVPETALSEIQKGKRAIVQFGRKKIYAGIIKNIHHNKPDYRTKELISIMDETPLINEYQFRFWDWIAEYYMCTLGEIHKAALPEGLKLESETLIALKPDADYADITEKEELVIGLLTNETHLSIAKLASQADFNVLPAIKKLLDKGIIYAEEHIRQKYKVKYEEYLSLLPELNNETALNEALQKLQRAKKQQALLLQFIHLTKYGNASNPKIKPGAELLKKELMQYSGTSASVLKSLIDRGYLVSTKKEVSYFIKPNRLSSKENSLNEAQQKAFEQIKQAFDKEKAVLLHGITSSGKTEIYIKLIKEQIAKGKQVLYLLPEIALTSQITGRLEKIFGEKLGIYHSKFNNNERVEVWKNLEKGKFKIILGVRSSIFLPFNNLGLIIVDEEHENSYKQQSPAPRYNARDASLVLALLHKADVLLGTATPSMESYYNAKSGKYVLVELFQRYQNIKLPEIRIADIKEARRKKKMRSLFTPELLSEIQTTLRKKEQVILFQNRRGFSPYTECETCGYIPKCVHCDVSLTYHKFSNLSVCHYCGYSENATIKCKACESSSMVSRGFGTQKIEEEIRQFFPDARFARMDTDSTSSKKKYNKIIHDYESGNTDILIGTQMISKGLDFDNVALVGIMNADNILNFPDFRAHERSFQLMTQVSGRAGRKNKQGQVIIQTSDKNHPLLQNVVQNDFETMFMTQLQLRKKFHYPPFFRLLQISLKHKHENITKEAAAKLAKELRQIFGQRILGPEAPLISKLKNQYIQVILIKIERKIAPDKAKKYIRSAIYKLQQTEKYKYVQIIPDVDPM